MPSSKTTSKNSTDQRRTGVRYHWTPEQKQQMIELYQHGYSTVDIGEMMGCCSYNIQYHLRRMGITLRGVGQQTAIARAKYSSERHHGWKGGRSKETIGYILVLNRDHPCANKDGYVREHRLVMEEYVKRTNPDHPALEDGVLSKDWVVHHKNGKKDDNRLDNLELMPKSEHHSWMHFMEELGPLRDEITRLRALLKKHNLSLPKNNHIERLKRTVLELRQVLADNNIKV